MSETRTDKLSADEIKNEFFSHIDDSVNIAMETIKGQIDWLAYVPEHEFTEGEHERLINAAWHFYQTIRRLTHKYID